jgi:hypothetical protein
MIFITEGEKPIIALCSGGVVLVIRPSDCPPERLIALARLVLSDADLAELTERLGSEAAAES